MSGSNRSRRTAHTAVVPGSPDQVFELVAEVRRWPVVFGPTVHVEHFGREGDRERFRIWALVNDRVSTWTSSRVLDPVDLRIRFAQDRSQAPVASMRGEWLFRPASGGGTEVRLSHEFTVVDDDADALDWVTTAVDRNSPAELAALARVAGLGRPVGDLVVEFADTVTLSGSPADAFEFVDRADRWAERLPHVRRVRLTEDEPGSQTLEMETVTGDGSTHRTRSVRVCRATDLIAYKQLEVPKLLLGHSGTWTFADRDGATEATARHLVLVDPEAAAAQFGGADPLAAARAYVRDALGANSRTTLARAGEFAAARRAADAAAR
ncbi:aromatase/cyclase [Micromonospora maritima]|uniref:aromatase/cyclase n=2 Tax=Micromonospora maritima TaxID=986711 RepID=UPI0031E93694